jgi:hypothetical protein
MADRPSDDERSSEDKQATGGQQSHRSEYGGQADQTDPSMSRQGREGSSGGQSPGEGDGMSGQPIGGNDSNSGTGTTLTAGYALPRDSKVRRGEGAEPPRSMGTHGDEFGQMSDYDRSGQQGQSGTGQADLGTQSDSTLSGHTDQQDLATDQPGRVAGATDSERFIARPDAAGDRQRQDRPVSEKTGGSSSAKASGGSDFAREGRGATEQQDQTTDSEQDSR